MSLNFEALDTTLFLYQVKENKTFYAELKSNLVSLPITTLVDKKIIGKWYVYSFGAHLVTYKLFNELKYLCLYFGAFRHVVNHK